MSFYKPTAKRVRELYDYKFLTGMFVRKTDINKVFKKGSIAGCREKNGYILIRVDGKQYLAHRLAFLWMTGKWPPEQVDHKNSNRSDNKWRNLRLATHIENSRHRRKITDGFKGAYFCKQKERWCAKINVDSKQIHLGVFGSALEAHKAYIRASIKYFGEFARAA